MSMSSFLRHLHKPTFRTYSTATFSSLRSAKFLASAASPSSIPKLNSLPEVIVTGRANSGKSTLLNALLCRKDMFHASSKAGRTTTLNFVQVGPDSETGHLVLVDAPGYGARGRPEWGEVFEHYLHNREQLKRVYILFNAKHPLNAYDHQMLEHLSSVLLDNVGNQRWTLQAVITKADALVGKKKSKVVKSRKAPARKGEGSDEDEGEEGIIAGMMKEIWTHAPLCLPPIVTSAAMSPQFGIDVLRKDVLNVCGLPV